MAAIPLIFHGNCIRKISSFNVSYNGKGVGWQITPKFWISHICGKWSHFLQGHHEILLRAHLKPAEWGLGVLTLGNLRDVIFVVRTWKVLGHEIALNLYGFAEVRFTTNIYFVFCNEIEWITLFVERHEHLFCDNFRTRSGIHIIL